MELYGDAIRRRCVDHGHLVIQATRAEFSVGVFMTLFRITLAPVGSGTGGNRLEVSRVRDVVDFIRFTRPSLVRVPLARWAAFRG